MHINVSHILASEVGDSADFDLRGENPDIPDLELIQPLTGNLTVTKLEDNLRLKGHVRLVFKLECQRCLDPYEHEAEIALNAVASLKPVEDEWPISPRGELNLTQLIREETLVNIPVRQICAEDCQGLCAQCGVNLSDGHKHKLEKLGNKPRMKKGQ